ncbi:MAG: MATE family efflux transporter [Acidobacteriota bacterium]|jgi:MATE family multidrug resistance protein
MFRLALPVVIVQLGTMTMGVVDAVMVGHVSAPALAAVALGNVYFMAVAVFGMGTLMALDPVIAQAVGAGDVAGVARGIQRGLGIALLLTVPTSSLLVPGEWLLGLLQQPEEILPIASSYARVSILGAFPFFAFIVLRQSLQALGHLSPIVVAIVGTNIANVALNWLLVFGNLGFPRMGPIGSAWATAICRWLLAAGLLALAWGELRPSLWPPRDRVLRAAPLLRMLRLGVPIGGAYQLEYSAFGAIALLMGWLGARELAAHHVALNLAALTFMVPMGIAAAAAVRVGIAVGRQDAAAARRAAGVAALFAVAFMSLAAATFLLFPGPLARIFTEEDSVIAGAMVLIPIAGFFQVFDGLQVVGAGILRGLGDTRSPLVISVLGFWMIGFPVSLLLGFRMGMGGAGLWWGFVAALGAVALALGIQAAVRLGRHMPRVAIDDDIPAAIP